jgi:YVTN family beta-propeller protein
LNTPGPIDVAITPDGTRAYVTATGRPDAPNTVVFVIDTAPNTVVYGDDVVLSCSPPGTPFNFCIPTGIAVTPDGLHAYVRIEFSNGVPVIDTSTNMQVALVTAGPQPPFASPGGVAVTPDGKDVYVTNSNNTVSVIDTATNTVVATVPVAAGAIQVATYPPTPFTAFSAKLDIEFGKQPSTGAFELRSEFTLGRSSNGINPPAEPVTLTVGTFATTIPPGSFTGKGYGPFHFEGTINGAALQVSIVPTGAKRYAFDAAAQNANLSGTTNPVTVTLTIGDDTGTTSVNAKIRGSEISKSDWAA